MFERLQAFFLAGKLELQEMENRFKAAKKESELIDENSKLVEASRKSLLKQFEDEDEAQWMEAGNNDEKALSQSDTFDLIRKAQHLYYKNPHARGIIRLYEKYVTGRGFKISPKTTNEKWIDYWHNFETKNKFTRKRKELIRRTKRDGESFTRFFYSPGVTYIRFMNPLKIEDPSKKYTGGIQTDPDDIENVIAYYYGTEAPIPAEEILHEKILVDSDVKRGRSILEVIARPLEQYRDWISDRMKLNKIRAVMGLIKKVKGTSVQAENIATSNLTTKRKAPDGSAYDRVPEGVSVVTTNQGVDYEFKTPNLQASDVQHDGNTLLNQIAAGEGFPNWMITSDPSNANYASSLVSEAPGVKELQDWQDFYYDTFQEIYRRVMQNGIDNDSLPEMEEVEVISYSETGEKIIEKEMKAIDLEAYIIFPELVHRDIFNETRSLGMQRSEGALSLHNYSAKLDLDYEEEQEMRKQEKKESGEDEDSKEPEGDTEDVMRDVEAEEAFKKQRKDFIHSRTVHPIDWDMKTDKEREKGV